MRKGTKQVMALVSMIFILVVPLAYAQTEDPGYKILVDSTGLYSGNCSKCGTYNSGRSSCSSCGSVFSNAKKQREIEITTEDQQKITAIAMNAFLDTDVRTAAVNKILDQVILEDIARKAGIWDVRDAAANTLNDKTLAASINVDLAKNDNDMYMRAGAVEKLSDQDLLTYIAKNEKESYVRSLAVKKLSDQTVLLDIIQNDKNSIVRVEAIKKLTDKLSLLFIYNKSNLNNDRLSERIAAKERLNELLNPLYKK